MELARLDEKGQVAIPEAILKKLGLEGGEHLIVETSEDGAIILRPPPRSYDIEIYTDERIAEFEEANRIPPELEARLERFLARRHGSK